MISEVTFARDYASFWRLATPMMDGFVRRLNRGTYDRDFQPINAGTAASRRAFVNEFAFSTFCRVIEIELATGNPHYESSDAISVVANQVDIPPHAGREGNYFPALSEDEVNDVTEQVFRLQRRLVLARASRKIVCRPSFLGCGIIDRCEGDVLAGNTLFEIKAGDRSVRSIDLRQILTYLALNHAGSTKLIDTIGLINPRIGISFEMPIDIFCFELSGRHATELLDFIVHNITSGDISR